MNNEDVDKIIGILCKADGGCGNCAQSALAEFREKFNFDKEDFLERVKKIATKQKRYWVEDLDKFYENFDD